MSVVWLATSPEESWRLTSPERSDLLKLESRFQALRSVGQGYIEVSSRDESTQLTLSFRGDHAVIHLLDVTPAARCSLLRGDGSVAPASLVEVPVLTEPAGFTGYFVMRLEHAWDVVRAFARTGSPDGLGEWIEL